MNAEFGSPLILYIPGLLPKPEYRPHKRELKRCLVAGVQRVDSSIGAVLERSDEVFDIVAWTHEFYGEQRNIALDQSSIDAVVAQSGPSANDIAEATSGMRRLTVWLYRLGDYMPFLIPHLATERMELHLRDLRRYVSNRDGAGDSARAMFKSKLRDAHASGRPILLIAHSMGSVIAYDSLWEMSREEADPVTVDIFLTMGSPLGQNYLQRCIMGRDRDDSDRYPDNISRWVNLSAVGDLTSIDPHMRNDFGAMQTLGLVEDIEDIEVFNYFRLNDELNVHAEYGYLVNEVTANVVVSWMQQQTLRGSA